jgi:hypothetical protein
MEAKYLQLLQAATQLAYVSLDVEAMLAEDRREDNKYLCVSLRSRGSARTKPRVSETVPFL